MLKLDDPSIVQDAGIYPLSIGDSDGLGNLTPVIAIGYPNGDYSIKRGDINSDSVDDLALFKIDNAMNPGDSGGPLVLEDEQTVIGMMVGGLTGAEGENVANKINNIMVLLDEAGVVLD